MNIAFILYERMRRRFSKRVKINLDVFDLHGNRAARIIHGQPDDWPGEAA